MESKSKSKLALTGGAAAAEALRQIEPDVMAVYPITPQTPIIETYSKLVAEGQAETEMIQVESEHSALSACVGASAAGGRVITATSSQGLALMNEVLYIASGLRLPILMVVSARALSAPINIHGDHSDVMDARDSGWLQLFCENAQEVYDKTIIGMKLAEKVKLPVMVIMDGFNTSHSVENLEVLEKSEVQKFLGEYQPEESLLDIQNPVSFGFLALQNSYFEFRLEQEKAMQEAKQEYLKIAAQYEKLSRRNYPYFESYKLEDAKKIIVLAGSASGTAKEVVDSLRKEGEKVGLLKINLFRPFPHGEIAEALAKAEEVAVLDRTLSVGTYSPLTSEIMNALFVKNLRPKISSYVYGLGGRDIFQNDIEKVFRETGEDGLRTKYININQNE